MALTKHAPADTGAITPNIPALCQDDRLCRAEFHARYEAMPPDLRAELIEGAVHIMPSPVSTEHGFAHWRVAFWLALFVAEAPGVAVALDTTLALGEATEVQPDATVYLRPEFGGNLDVGGKYLAGTPELVVEVAISTSAQDLRAKKRDYERAGIPEYVVVLPAEQEVRWFVLRERRYVPLLPGTDGVLRSEVFPGLWLDPQALLSDDLPRLKAAAQIGLQGPAHRSWADRLSRSRRESTGLP